MGMVMFSFFRPIQYIIFVSLFICFVLILYIIVEPWRTDIGSPTYFVNFVALRKSTHASYVIFLYTVPMSN